MSTADPTMDELRNALSLPAPSDPTTLSRRRFLQAAAAGVGASMVPGWFADVAGASGSPASTSGGTGTLVLVVLDGGCDGLHVVPPVGSGHYQDARGALAVSESDALDIGGGRAFHPALPRLKARFDIGDVAVIDGVGNARRDLSHFSAMADFQHGGPAAQFSRTGWLGRWLDQSSGGPFEAIAIGHRIPLVAHGTSRSAMTLPWKIEHVPRRRDWAAPMDDAVDAWSQIAPGRGALADRVVQATSAMLQSSDALRPSYAPDSSGDQLAGELELCANLVNAGLGTRVLTVRHGPYDSHTNQTEMLGARLAELDAAIETFFQTLSAAVVDDVTLVCISEFGRRVAANGGLGTDHGAGNSMLAVGSGVVGGLHGSLPSLTTLTADGNLQHDIDYRSVFATILDDVLEADHASILGGQFDTIPFLEAGTPTPDASPRGRNGVTPIRTTKDPKPSGRGPSDGRSWNRTSDDTAAATTSAGADELLSGSRADAGEAQPAGRTSTSLLEAFDVDEAIASSTKIRGRLPLSALRR